MWNFRIFEKSNLRHLVVPQKPKQPNHVINLGKGLSLFLFVFVWVHEFLILFFWTKSHMNPLIYAFTFNIPPQTQGVTWQELEFGFQKRKTATKAEKLGFWLGSQLRCSMAWLGSLLDDWSRLRLVGSWLNGSTSTQWLRGSDLECLGSISAHEERELKSIPQFFFFFELWKKKERMDC